MLFKRILFVMFISGLTHPSMVWAEEELKLQQCKFNGIDYDAAVSFAGKLQQAIKNNDKQALVQLADFPLRVNQGPKKITMIKSSQQFIKKYNSVMTASVKKQITDADTKDIFCNFQGAMVGNGVIWFQGKPMKFFSINQ